MNSCFLDKKYPVLASSVFLSDNGYIIRRLLKRQADYQKSVNTDVEKQETNESDGDCNVLSL